MLLYSSGDPQDAIDSFLSSPGVAGLSAVQARRVVALQFPYTDPPSLLSIKGPAELSRLFRRARMIRAEHVSVIAGERILLDDVSLEVPTGSVTGIVGPNGSGKTTLLRALIRATPVARGRITLDGRDSSEHAHDAGSPDASQRSANASNRTPHFPSPTRWLWAASQHKACCGPAARDSTPPWPRRFRQSG